jgi:uncharacterized protein (TIGR02145 family)
MKQFFFLFTMLASIATSATVKVTPLSTDYTNKKVTFKVEWTNTPQAPYLNRVWIWIDFCPVTSTIPANSFSTATISNPTKTGGNGTISNSSARGFFITHSAINAGTTITATLSNAPTGKFNWCAYASDFPPNAFMSAGSYTLHGSPPFVVNGNPLASGVTQYVGSITSLTDATGAPGIFCMPVGQTPGTYGCCSGLSVDASSGLCATPTMCDPTSTLSLGVVSFSPGSEITITGSSYTQVWSRPVTAIGCQKTTYYGGTSSSKKCDCRNNPGYAGDLFSWCASIKYADQLCPFPWRIPTSEDVCKLHKAVTGSTACNSSTNSAWVSLYQQKWDVEFAGRAENNGAFNYRGNCAHFIVSGGTQDNHARFNFDVYGYFQVGLVDDNKLARNIRCVRD